MQYGARMLAGSGRRVKLIPALLALVGSVALAAGLFVAVITMTRTPADHQGINMPLGGAVYVGDDTCFTCHKDQNPDWSLTLDAQPAAAPMANPQVIAVDINVREAVPHLELNATAALPADSKDKQQYIIETEDDHVSLPRLMDTAAVKPMRATLAHRQIPAIIARQRE